MMKVRITLIKYCIQKQAFAVRLMIWKVRLKGIQMKNMTRSRLLPSLVILSILNMPFSALYAQEHSVRPGVNRHYISPDFNEWVHRFERPGREIYDKRLTIVSATGIEPGMVAADIGAGTGLFTRLFSSRVGPRGRVIAVDISKPFIDNILRTSRQQGLMNVEGIVNSPRETSLPEASIDLAFICDTYHHFEYPHSTMRSLHPRPASRRNARGH